MRERFLLRAMNGVWQPGKARRERAEAKEQAALGALRVENYRFAKRKEFHQKFWQVKELRSDIPSTWPAVEAACHVYGFQWARCYAKRNWCPDPRRSQ